MSALGARRPFARAGQTCAFGISRSAAERPKLALTRLDCLGSLGARSDIPDLRREPSPRCQHETEINDHQEQAGHDALQACQHTTCDLRNADLTNQGAELKRLIETKRMAGVPYQLLQPRKKRWPLLDDFHSSSRDYVDGTEG